MEVESFLDRFEDFPDHRIDRKKLYTVLEILIVALCGTIFGCEGWEDLEDYGKTGRFKAHTHGQRFCLWGFFLRKQKGCNFLKTRIGGMVAPKQGSFMCQMMYAG